jgi:hypothetical protein
VELQWSIPVALVGLQSLTFGATVAAQRLEVVRLGWWKAVNVGSCHRLQILGLGLGCVTIRMGGKGERLVYVHTLDY